jgi:molybdenum cofactor synthesis domain-containing protein
MDNPSHPAPGDAYAQWTDACARAGWQPRDPGDCSELVPLADAPGRVTAEPVTARWPSPRANCAAMDGIAVNAEKSGIGGAGHMIVPGDFAWIDTGDPMPPGTDTVIRREYVVIDNHGAARIDAGAGTVRAGRHVRERGEDFGVGEILVPAGRRVTPADVAVAAAAGRPAIAVSRRPTVAIIPTGDEIVPVGRLPEHGLPEHGLPEHGLPACELPEHEPPKHGEIIDSNSVYLAARCAQAGGRARVSDIVPDDPDRLAAEIRRAAADADLVLVIAGSSRGRGDHTGAVLQQTGGLIVAGVAVHPGHPALLGYAKPDSAAVVPVIGLPGYPLATAVIFELFAAPLLASLLGDAAPPARTAARLSRDWTSSPDVEEWVPVSLSPDGTATPAGHGSSSTSRLARSAAWWPIPAGQARFPAGAEIEILPFR